MARELRQSTAFTHKTGPFLDTAGAVVTTLDIDQADVKLSKNGGALTQKNDATANAAYDANGFYLITCDATDSGTLGHLRMSIVESGALPVTEDFFVLSQFEWDRKYSAQSMQLSGVTGYGTAQSASGSGIVVASGAAYEDSILVGQTVSVLGTDEGGLQSRVITANDESSDSVDVSPDFTETPSGAPIYYAIYPAPAAPTAAASLPQVILGAAGSVDLTEGYAPDTEAFTLAEAIYGIHQMLTEFAVSGTTATVKKRDKSTTAFTQTLSDATDPTSITQAT